MNSRSGDRVPAGVSGEAGRGTVGAAPTTPIDSDEFVVWMFSRVLAAAAVAYAVAGIAITWVAFLLSPWGLLLLILAFAVLAAATLSGFIAFGVSRLEVDPA